MKINFDEKMQEIIKNEKNKPKLLLHSCCAPCSSACLERIAKHFQVTVLYYNPNIDDEAEYEKRKSEQIRFLQETGYADVLDCGHEKEKFEEMAKGLEEEPERGKRCYLCYELRLKKTAEVAKARAFDYFCTTLTLSPHKNADWLNEIGYRLEKELGVNYLPSDFKKQGGYLRSIELSNEYGLYRQSFCGCKYSKR
ncbi:MAG: epoxyqueuosine reductase QueH [Clostridia bacterium]|nr:epoxyqueuosine reductase QueH [Clostridia bacterium]